MYGQREELDPEQQKYLRKTRHGANWFFWIAGISVLNIILFLSGQTLNFVIGLGATDLATILAKDYASASLTALVILRTVILLGIFVVGGYFGRKAKTTAFIAGMVIYIADALIYVPLGYWPGIIFHLLVLVFVFMGFQAARKYNDLQKPTIISQ